MKDTFTKKEKEDKGWVTDILSYVKFIYFLLQWLSYAHCMKKNKYLLRAYTYTVKLQTPNSDKKKVRPDVSL